MLAPLLDMHGVAAFRGVHYDTVRKGWPSWVREQGFPAPVGGKPYRWAPAALEAWRDRAQAAALAAVIRAPATGPGAAANENTLSGPPTGPLAGPLARRIDRQRHAVLQMMGA